MRKFHLVDIEWDENSLREIANHGLEFWEVEEAAIYDSERTAREVADEEHGERIQIIGTCEQNGKRLRVFVRPVDKDLGIGRVLTAWRIEI